MGDKSSWKREYPVFFITVNLILAALLVTACAPVQEKIAEIKAQQQLDQYREKLANGFFETVILQAQQILEENDAKPPADVALYALGEVYAHHDFAGEDLGLSQYYFEKLSEKFPDSPLTAEAKVYINIFETIAAKEKEAALLQKRTREKDKQYLEKDKQFVPGVTGKIVENQNFEEAVRKNLLLLEKAGDKKPADQALYVLGLLYAHYENPEQDYKKSQLYLQQLLNKFPDSAFAEEARIWLGLFETIEKIQQIDIDIERQKKQLTH